MNATSTVTAAATQDERKSRHWLIVALGVILLCVGSSTAVAWRMDVYGIFRDPHGRDLITSSHERRAKFLLNQAYVPANFDALVIGASSQVNWLPEYFSGYRFYNESLEGGNASEERRLVEQAMPHGHFKVAIVGLYPRTTKFHDLQDGFDTVRREEALGSISSLGVEYDILMSRFMHQPSRFFPNGSHSFPQQVTPKPHARGPHVIIAQDPVAVADYIALVQELQNAGTRIVYVVNPMYEPEFEYDRDEIQSYTAMMTKKLPAGPVIDFLSADYASFRTNPHNFIDDVHLSSTGANTLSRIINVRLQRALQ